MSEELGRAVVITCSTRAAGGVYPDRGGPLLVEALREWGFACGDPVVVPDGPLVVNPGSLGLPGFRISREPAHRQEAGTPHARYAVLHLDGDSVQVEMLAIAYDWDAAARRAEEVGFNGAWPHVIRTGLLPESA